MLQRFDLCPLSAMSSLKKTIEDLVRRLVLTIYDIVENPEMRPIKDYIDYTKYVNGQFPK